MSFWLYSIRNARVNVNFYSYTFQTGIVLYLCRISIHTPTCRQSVPSQQHFRTIILEPEDLNLFVVSTHLPDIFLSYYKAFGFTDLGKEETENFNNRFRKRENMIQFYYFHRIIAF